MDLDKLAAEIASRLGWRVEPRGPDARKDVATLLGPNEGERVWFRLERQDKRLEFHGDYPRFADRTSAVYPGRDKAPRVSVSAERSPEAIAADLTRRFLPAYRALLAEVQQRVYANNQWREAKRKNAERLAEACDVKALAQDADSFRCDVGDGWVDVKVSDTTATLEIRSLSIEAAENVLLLLKGRLEA